MALKFANISYSGNIVCVVRQSCTELLPLYMYFKSANILPKAIWDPTAKYDSPPIFLAIQYVIINIIYLHSPGHSWVFDVSV